MTETPRNYISIQDELPRLGDDVMPQKGGMVFSIIEGKDDKRNIVGGTLLACAEIGFEEHGEQHSFMACLLEYKKGFHKGLPYAKIPVHGVEREVIPAYLHASFSSLDGAEQYLRMQRRTPGKVSRRAPKSAPRRQDGAA